MKISFDLDGTLFDQDIGLVLQVIFLNLQEAGHEVGILTGHAAGQRGNDLHKLERMGIKPDFYIGSEKGFPDEQQNARWKAEQIRKYKIDYHFDDSAHLIREAS